MVPYGNKSNYPPSYTYPWKISEGKYGIQHYQAGFNIIKKTYDLHSEPNFWYNIETEHEKMFSEQGIKIKAVIAKNAN